LRRSALVITVQSSPLRGAPLPDPASSPGKQPFAAGRIVAELRRRGVLRVAAIYLGSAWLVIEVANTTVPRLGLPDAWISGVIVLALVCFPAVVAGAWFFDLRRDAGSPTEQPLLSGTQARLGVFTAALLGTALLAVVGWSALQRTAHEPAPTGAPPQHVAVLYFEDRTADPAYTWLAGTLTETLTSALAQVPGLRVASSNAVRALSGAALRPDSLGRLLGAGTLVSGSLSSAGDSVRLLVQLVDAGSGAVLNTGAFTRSATDAFVLVDEFVRDIAPFLRTRIGRQVALHTAAGTLHAGAWEVLQRARQLSRDAGDLRAGGAPAAAEQALAAADSLLALAEQLDPRYVDAMIERAFVARGRAFNALHPSLGGMVRVEELLVEGEAHARRALHRDRDNARALEQLGMIQQLQLMFGDHDAAARAALLGEAERTLRRAVARDTTRVRAYATLSSILDERGEFAEARVLARRALQADAFLEGALDVLNRLFVLAFELGDYREAAHWCDELGRREQAALTTASCRLMLAAWAPFVEPDGPAAWRLVDAGVAGASAHELRFREPLLQALAAAVLARAGMPDSAQHVLDRALTASEYVPEVLQIGAGVHLLRRDHDAARALLRRYIDVVGELPPLLAESRRLGQLTRSELR
jgi:TolB-like protein/Tfp pilus assembly protein PilF